MITAKNFHSSLTDEVDFDLDVTESVDEKVDEYFVINYPVH